MSFFKKITLSGFLIALSSLIFLVFFYRDYFSSEIQIWCEAHLKVFFSAILITLLSRLIGLLKSEDFENSDSFHILFSIQMTLSYIYNDKDYGTSTYSFFIWFFPTIVFIARKYFKRIQRIENRLDLEALINRNDPKFMLKAIKTIGESAIKEASPDLLKDPKFMIKALKLNSKIIYFLSNELKNNKEFINLEASKR